MCSRIGSVTTLSKPGEARAKKLRELNKSSRVPFALCTVRSFFCRAEKGIIERTSACSFGDFAAENSRSDSESIAMETLYDLLGALPNDDADDLRAAFRRAVKRAHPDVNPEDPDAGLKFRRIVRANEILGDAEQRGAYDHLLEVARLEQEQAAKQPLADAEERAAYAPLEQVARHALANKVQKVASGVMALAGISVIAVGGYALFVQLSANALTPATATTEAVREPAAIVATGPAEEGAASVSAAPQETSGRADITTSAIVPAAETAPGREGPPPGHTPKHAPKFASAYTDRGIFLYHLRKFTHAFAELAEAKRPHGASRPIRSPPPQSGTRQRD
jgi:DnaJ domain